MQIESIDQKSFVDLLDGYTHLPTIPDKYLRPGQAMIRPEYLSVVLHEYSHQLAITSVFGAASACLTAMAMAGQRLAHFESFYYSRPLVNTLDKKRIDESIQVEAINLFLAHYSRPLENYYALAAGSRWLLEGIALFAEHDFRPSKEFNAASQYFEFIISMLQSQKGGKQVTIKDVDELIEDSLCSDYARQNKWLLMSNSDHRTGPYFAGYIIVRGLQYFLSQIDQRLADPEIFLIFISGYFFNDFRLLTLCSIPNKQVFSQALKIHYSDAIDKIIHTEANLLRSAVDRIVNYQQYPNVDFHHTDFASLLVNSGNSSVSEDFIYEAVGKNINEYLTNQLQEFTDLVPTEQLSELIQGISEEAETTYKILRTNGFFFKLKHVKSVLLGYNEEKEFTALSVATPGAGLHSAFFVSNESFQVLQTQIEMESLSCSNGIRLENLDDQLQHAINADNACWLELYDAFDIEAQERFQLLMRNDFQHVRSFYKENAPVQNASIIRALGSYFSRTGYWDLVQINVPSFLDSNLWTEKVVENIETDVLLSVWRVIFPNAKVADSDLIKFWEKKIYLIAPDSLAALQQVITGVKNNLETKDNLEVANKRWERFVGVPLMQHVQDKIVLNF